MASGHPQDLRERVIEAVMLDAMSCQAAPRRCDRLLAVLLADPPITLAALAERLPNERSRRSLDAEPISLHRGADVHKKTLHAGKKDRPDVARTGCPWQVRQGRVNPPRLIFIDEIWTRTVRVRSRGRCSRSERLIDEAPRNGQRLHARRDTRRYLRSRMRQCPARGTRINLAAK